MLFIRTKLAMAPVPNRRLAVAAEKKGNCMEGVKFDGANVPISAQSYLSGKHPKCSYMCSKCIVERL